MPVVCLDTYLVMWQDLNKKKKTFLCVSEMQLQNRPQAMNGYVLTESKNEYFVDYSDALYSIPTPVSGIFLSMMTF
jgi:hypothetical protein